MRRYLVPALAVLGLATSAVAVTPAPASAHHFTTSISALDTSQLGHVTGTVTTTAPYISLSLLNWALNEIDPVIVPLPQGGEHAFDLETWGYGNAAVSARPCSTSSPSSCEQQVLSEWFEPEAPPAPVVNWPDSDTTIGPGQTYPIEIVSDSGFGQLRAHWSGVTDPLAMGLNDYTFRYEGTGPLTIMRCADAGSPCRSTGNVRALTVRHFFPVTTANYWLGAISPVLGTPLRPKYTTSEGDEFTFDWTVTSRVSETPLLQGTVQHVMADNGVVSPSIDLSSLGDGEYRITGELSYLAPEFGWLVSKDLQPANFTIDTTGPIITSVKLSRPTIYPFDDGYQDKIEVKTRWSGSPRGDVRLEVVNAKGAVVRTMRTDNRSAGVGAAITWDGRSDGGGMVPAGDYTFRMTVFDRPAGNPSAAVDQPVTVVRQRLDRRQFTKKLSAAGSLVDTYVGKCSRLAKPSARGWTGSLGLYTNTRCNRTFDDGLVATMHRGRVPRAVKYHAVIVSTTGGAATSKPQSLAYQAYVSDDGSWFHDKRLGPQVGSYQGHRTYDGFVLPGRYVYWVVYTAEGARFDLRSFTLTAKYSVLVDD